MKVWVALTEIGLFLNILHVLRSLVGNLSKTQPELPDLKDILAFFIYLVVMIYLIMVVMSYKAEIESRSIVKPLPFQVVSFVAQAICWADDFITNSQLRLFQRWWHLHRQWTSQASGASGRKRMSPTSSINHLSEPAVSAMFTPDLSICLC